MRIKLLWDDQIPNREHDQCSINAVSMRPDGSVMIVAVGNRLLLYDCKTGELIQTFKGHTDTVYCVVFSQDGKRFASGGRDKSVIVWQTTGGKKFATGKIKYPHNDSIQCLAFNPVTQQLASCTASDFGLWAPEENIVNKKKIYSKILCCSWTNDGTHLALGLLNGTISIRNNEGKEKVTIQRNAPIWCLQWNPNKDETYDTLAVGCWDQTLSFYHLSGKQIGKDKKLGYDPCGLTYYWHGKFIIVGGSDRSATLWTKDGVKMLKIAERDDWIMCITENSQQGIMALGTNDGRLECYKLSFSTIHGLYQHQYAFRDSMVNVIVHDLMYDRKLRIKCNDYVKRIAVYRDRLAIQLPNRINVYEKVCLDSIDDELKYKLKYRINQTVECSLLVVTLYHVILCLEKKLIMYDFAGVKEREWETESEIRYIKVIGGQPKREALLVGLLNGAVLKIFIDNPFPIQLFKTNESIRCLDLSASRLKLAVVDEQYNLFVYNLKTKQMIFQETTANSVSWNSEYEDMLCYSSTTGYLNIKTGTFPVYQQKYSGFVVGFKGSKIFCLVGTLMNTIDVPQSASLYNYLNIKDYENAYKIACLGVTEEDWRRLAMQALMGLKFDIARKAFIRIRDFKYLALLDRFETLKDQKVNENLFLAEILAYQGKFEEAATAFLKAQRPDIALDMLCDLRMFKKAQEFAQSCDQLNVTEILLRQARTAEEDGDLETASQLYLASKSYMKAINIMGDNKWLDSLIRAARTLDKNKNRPELEQCAYYFTKHKHHEYASEVYTILGEWEKLVKLHVQMEKWEDAFRVLETHPEFTELVYLPYAEFLVLNDRFDEALEAYKKAKQPVMALSMIEQLACSAVIEQRFNDASYYFWRLSIECLNIISDEKEYNEYVKEKLEYFYNCSEKAKLYYTYHFIHLYMETPFSAMDPKWLFNMACHLFMKVMDKEAPFGISKVNIVIALAKLATILGEYKLAREAYSKLDRLRIPNKFRDEIELAAIAAHGKPMTNNEELIPICYRCSASNPLINKGGDECVNCHHPFVRSFHSFDILPLVEFVLEDGISEREAIQIIESGRGRGYSKNVQEVLMEGEDAQTLMINNTDELDDPFSKAMMSIESSSNSYSPVVVGYDMLKTFRKEEIFIVRHNCTFIPTKFYRHVLKDVSAPIVQCKTCSMFFHEEDFEFEVMKKGGCPFCRTQLVFKIKKDDEE